MLHMSKGHIVSFETQFESDPRQKGRVTHISRMTLSPAAAHLADPGPRDGVDVVGLPVELVGQVGVHHLLLRVGQVLVQGRRREVLDALQGGVRIKLVKFKCGSERIRQKISDRGRKGYS